MCKNHPKSETDMTNKPTSWFLNELKQLIPAITYKWDNMHIPPHMTHMLIQPTCTQCSNLPPALFLDNVSQDYLCSVKNKKLKKKKKKRSDVIISKAVVSKSTWAWLSVTHLQPENTIKKSHLVLGEPYFYWQALNKALLSQLKPVSHYQRQ